eukprot:610865-Amphidinium_carterae.1
MSFTVPPSYKQPECKGGAKMSRQRRFCGWNTLSLTGILACSLGSGLVVVSQHQRAGREASLLHDYHLSHPIGGSLVQPC